MPYPKLTLSTWQPTRDTLQAYTKIVGRVRRILSPPQKHWCHISLPLSPVGLTTTPIPCRDHGRTFDIEFNFFTHETTVRTNSGDIDVITLEGQSPRDFGEELLEILASFDIDVELPAALLTSTEEGSYNDAAVEAYWQALCRIDSLFKQFKGELRQETTPVLLWPHHLDLAFMWLSGRLVPDQDPEDEELADEQMNFGFSTGDSTINEPYFYATAYPLPPGLIGSPLPEPAYWHTAGFSGAILPYAGLLDHDDPDQLLLDFLRTVQRNGASLMIG